MRRMVWLVVAAAMMGGGLAGTARGAAAFVTVGEYRISGPYVHKNLALFLVHGRDKIAGKRFLTLDEALTRKLVVVHETGNVSQLAVENKSPHVHIYIQSGVIVKGGKQDRTIQYDMVLPPRSGKVALRSFCVEAGRWNRRGGEAADQFAAAKSNLATKELKLAAKKAGSQQQVWKSVAKVQGDLGRNLNAPVRARASASSLQLTLENKHLAKAAGEYTGALSRPFARHTDVIGYAFAINGEVNSADVYGSRDLFAKLRSSLLHAAAVEAIAKMKKGPTVAAPNAQAIKALFLQAEQGKKSEKDLTGGARMSVKESDKSILFRVGDKTMPAADFYRLEILSK